MGAPEGKEREKGTGRISEDIMAQNFPNLIKYINTNDLQVGWTERDPHQDTL